MRADPMGVTRAAQTAELKVESMAHSRVFPTAGPTADWSVEKKAQQLALWTAEMRAGRMVEPRAH